MLNISNRQIRLPDRSAALNLTPVIDIVFLLIIFFCVVCQFIEAENFPVAVPDKCEFAETAETDSSRMTTVTLMKTETGGYSFAVGAERIEETDYSVLVERLVVAIDSRLANFPVSARVVTLRVDKDIRFDQAQFALAAIANSTATDIRLAALKKEGVSAH